MQNIRRKGLNQISPLFLRFVAFQFHENRGIRWVASDLFGALPGVVHAFSTRVGGVSQAPYDSLNLGVFSSDWYERWNENWSLFLSALGVPDLAVCYQSQVHGPQVREAPDAEGMTFLGEGDGLWTRELSVGLAAMTADCLPILLASRDGAVVASLHAGWRGLLAGIIERALGTLERECAVAPRDVRVAVGPHIGSCCFEVGDEVAARFRSSGGVEGVVQYRPEGRPTVALGRAAGERLLLAGVPSEAFDVCEMCTRCDRENFFSYRRDGSERGVMAGLVARAIPGSEANGGEGL